MANEIFWSFKLNKDVALLPASPGQIPVIKCCGNDNKCAGACTMYFDSFYFQIIVRIFNFRKTTGQ